MNLKQKNLIIIVVGILMTVVMIKGYFQKEQPVYVLSGPDSPLVLEEASEIDGVNHETITIHIEGQVNAPGVYELPIEQRVIDAVEAAGGLTEMADRSKVNMAKKIYDEEKIYIPALDEEVDDQISSGQVSQGAKKININQAGQQELTALPGIGEALADRIINYRQEYGNFKSPEEIKNVSGIGEKKFEDIKELIVVN
ncbi:helix-hairpin-helix domain-containing protein [Alkaliphilus crotonatoxidans]